MRIFGQHQPSGVESVEIYVSDVYIRVSSTIGDVCAIVLVCSAHLITKFDHDDKLLSRPTEATFGFCRLC